MADHSSMITMYVCDTCYAAGRKVNALSVDCQSSGRPGRFTHLIEHLLKLADSGHCHCCFDTVLGNKAPIGRRMQPESEFRMTTK